MTLLDQERERFGMGAKWDALMPLINAVRENSKGIEEEKKHDLTLKHDEEELEGKLWISSTLKNTIVFDSSNLSILLNSPNRNESNTVVYIHRPDINDGITAIKKSHSIDSVTLGADFIYGLLARDVDLTYHEKACCFLGHSRVRRLKEEEFEELLQFALKSHKREMLSAERFTTLIWSETLPFANLANKILVKGMSKKNLG